MVKVEGMKTCKKNFRKLKEQYITGLFTRTAQELIADAWESKQFTGFTGNTQTSYTCGVYIYGNLRYMVSAGDRSRKPVFRKVKMDETKYLYTPYEGDSRAVEGMVEVNGKSGQQTAENFLRNYKRIPKDGFALVMATGTEYSEYIEKAHDLSVLNITYLRAKSILSSNVKPIQS